MQSNALTKSIQATSAPLIHSLYIQMWTYILINSLLKAAADRQTNMYFIVALNVLSQMAWFFYMIFCKKYNKLRV